VRKNIFVVPLQLFGSTTSIISRFGERVRDNQYTVWSLLTFLVAVLLLTVPRLCPAICKSGRHAPVPYGVGITAGTSVWNNLPDPVRNVNANELAFRRLLKHFCSHAAIYRIKGLNCCYLMLREAI